MREVAVRTRNAAAGGIGPDAAAGARIPLDLSLPKASFTSESEFRREREAILFAGWFCVGRAESLPAAGDYLTADIAGESIIVVRCFPAVIRCPYHAWTYSLDGALRSAPFLPDLRRHRAALSLHQVDVDTWGGFVFVRCQPGSGPACPRSSGPAISASSCCPT